MPDPLRILIYARGTPDEIDTQQTACLAQLDKYVTVSLASDPPDGSAGWISANHMLANGEVDRILVTSRSVIPNVVESITQIRHGRRPRRLRLN